MTPSAKSPNILVYCAQFDTGGIVVALRREPDEGGGPDTAYALDVHARRDRWASAASKSYDPAVRQMLLLSRLAEHGLADWAGGNVSLPKGQPLRDAWAWCGVCTPATRSQ